MVHIYTFHEVMHLREQASYIALYMIGIEEEMPFVS